MKRKIVILLALLLLLPSFAMASTFDYALMFGSGGFYSSREGISFSYGMNFGLTRHLEISLIGMSELIPDIFNRNIFMLELGTTLQGARNTGSRVAGVCVNSIVAVGGFYRTDNHGAGIYFGVTPLSIGSPTTVRRERAFRTNVGYDFVNRSVIVTFSPLDIEVYLVGTYHDYT